MHKLTDHPANLRIGLPKSRPRPLKQRRYTHVKAMALCIAVKCRDDASNPRVVCCFDRQVGSDYESSESEYKFHLVGDRVALMYAGTLIPAQDLVAI
jgi:hypothetical protein